MRMLVLCTLLLCTLLLCTLLLLSIERLMRMLVLCKVCTLLLCTLLMPDAHVGTLQSVYIATLYITHA